MASLALPWFRDADQFHPQGDFFVLGAFTGEPLLTISAARCAALALLLAWVVIVVLGLRVVMGKHTPRLLTILRVMAAALILGTLGSDIVGYYAQLGSAYIFYQAAIAQLPAVLASALVLVSALPRWSRP